MRRIARETAFKILFSTQFIDGLDKNFCESVYKENGLSKDDEKYCNKLLETVFGHKEEISALVDKHSRLFPENRIFAADKSILYLAIAEILYFEDIPDVVSVNEAANIASKYSTDKSASFVSGILSEIIKVKNNV